MPIVGNKKYRYTKKGIAAARKAMKKYANGGVINYDQGGKAPSNGPSKRAQKLLNDVINSLHSSAERYGRDSDPAAMPFEILSNEFNLFTSAGGKGTHLESSNESDAADYEYIVRQLSKVISDNYSDVYDGPDTEQKFLDSYLDDGSGKAMTKYAEGGGPVVGDLLDTLKGFGKEGNSFSSTGFDSSEAAVSALAKGKGKMRDAKARMASEGAKSKSDETPSTPADPLGSGTGRGSGMGGLEFGIEKELGVGKRKSNTSGQRDDSFSRDLADEAVADARKNRDGGSANDGNLDIDDIELDFEDIEDEEEQVDKRTQRRESRQEGRRGQGKAAFKKAAGKVGGLMKKFREGYDRQTRKQPGYNKAKRSYSSYDEGGTVGEPSGPPYATSGPRANVPEEIIISGIKRSGEKPYTQPIIKAVNEVRVMDRPSINSLRRNTVFRRPLKPIVKPSQEFVNRRSIPSVTRSTLPAFKPSSQKMEKTTSLLPSVTRSTLPTLKSRPFIKDNQYIYPKK